MSNLLIIVNCRVNHHKWEPLFWNSCLISSLELSSYLAGDLARILNHRKRSDGSLCVIFSKIQNPSPRYDSSFKEIIRQRYLKSGSHLQYNPPYTSQLSNVWAVFNPNYRPQLTIIFLSNWCGNLKSNMERVCKTV